MLTQLARETWSWLGVSVTKKRHHTPTAPTHHLQTETSLGREGASVGVGTTDPKREESHDFSRVEDVK